MRRIQVTVAAVAGDEGVGTQRFTEELVTCQRRARPGHLPAGLLSSSTAPGFGVFGAVQQGDSAMAWPWLAAAVKTIPWATLVRRAPDIIDAAGSLMSSRKASQAADHTAARTESQLDELKERFDSLESHGQETARVVNQIAEQTRDLTTGIGILAAKVRLLSVLLVVTAVLAIIAIGTAAL